MEQQYVYMKVFADYKVWIMYQFGTYYVSKVIEKPDGLIAYTLRSYKTISGAERFMLNKVSPDCLEICRAPEKYIKEGSYWKKEC